MRPAKYCNIKTDGYDSRAEAKRAAELKLMLRAGQISNLLEQTPFELIPKDGKDRAVIYKADFTYVLPSGELVVEDVKGVRTPVYNLKKRLMWHIHRIRIREVA